MLAARLSGLGRRLGERGYSVEAPHYPGLNAEPIATFLPKVLTNHTFDADIFIGRSVRPTGGDVTRSSRQIRLFHPLP